MASVGMTPLRHFSALNIICPGFDPSVEWSGASAWPSVPRFHPDPDTAEGFASRGSGYVSENDFPFSPIEMQQALLADHEDQASFAESYVG